MTPKRQLAVTEQNRLRAVFDTNVVVAAIKSRSATSPNAELLRRWQNEEFELLYSLDLLSEYAEKLWTRRGDPDRVDRFLADLLAVGTPIQVEPDTIKPLIAADPDDDLVIACAVAGRATHLVTYDPHFACLGQQHRGIAIVDGLHFLYAVRDSANLTDGRIGRRRS